MIGSFIISTSVQPGRPKVNNPIVAVYMRKIVTQDGNSSAALKDCLTLETQMAEIHRQKTGSRP